MTNALIQKDIDLLYKDRDMVISEDYFKQSESKFDISNLQIPKIEIKNKLLSRMREYDMSNNNFSKDVGNAWVSFLTYLSITGKILSTFFTSIGVLYFFYIVMCQIAPQKMYENGISEFSDDVERAMAADLGNLCYNPVWFLRNGSACTLLENKRMQHRTNAVLEYTPHAIEFQEKAKERLAQKASISSASNGSAGSGNFTNGMGQSE